MSHTTPGPWRIIMGGLQGDDGFAIGSKINQEVVCERWPCTCDNADRARMIADGHLIAAAPEMLLALQDIVAGKYNGRPDTGRMRLRSIIAKATGTTTTKGPNE